MRCLNTLALILHRSPAHVRQPAEAGALGGLYRSVLLGRAEGATGLSMTSVPVAEASALMAAPCAASL